MRPRCPSKMQFLALTTQKEIMAAKPRQKPPFRAEHVCSLLRPKALSKKRAAEIAANEELNRLEEEGVRAIVKTQQDLGFRAVDDGKYRRHQFCGRFFSGLQGFEEVDAPSWDIFRSYVPDVAAFVKSDHEPGESIVCTDKIKHTGIAKLREWEFLKSNMPPGRGDYGGVASRLFNDIDAATYFLGYDTDRAGGFEPIRALPAHKSIVLGVITFKFAELEDLETLRERVFQAAEFVAEGAGQTREQALLRIGISPQCGFASHHLDNSILHEDMVNKLELVRWLAGSIWPSEP
ncbi:Uncharacterized protein CTA2_12812 [Colletotrichum tanaceti]|uniref:Cobalamin-independent methionine synthase MetE C-terminal/archaeal domain-containing protein n=1 Tax=Colletotrichum tanaceti TaxID=1306861 RepID=A0A4U6XGE4_9PEZI|nr:Uncharacterized protein CTA2_12812 [Colletotrichum tanaceti]TKW54771.1 uncharacterized protein CTA1_12204 [Colletotrichum tanaceti]